MPSIARSMRSGVRDVVAGRVDGDLVEPPQHLPAQRIDLGDRLDRVAEELDAHRARFLVRREDLDDVAAHAERAAVKVEVVALVLDVDQLAQHLVAVRCGAALEEDAACRSTPPASRGRRCRRRWRR